ncbi:MAG: RNA polymerase sigma factor, partial [Bacteroidota bacterium]
LFAYFKYAVYRCWVNSRKANSNVFSELRDEELEKFSLEIDAQIVRGELARLLDETIGRLGNRCQSILSLAIGGFSMLEIAEKMGFKGGEQVAKNEKRKCQE